MRTTVNLFRSVIELSFRLQLYNNGRVAIQAFDFSDGSPYGMVTINVPEVELERDEILVKTYSENAHWVPQVLENLKKHFVPTGRKIDYGNVELPVYIFMSEERLARIKQRLEEIRAELNAENISYDSLLELQGLSSHIEAGDMQLQEAAGIPEDEARK